MSWKPKEHPLANILINAIIPVLVLSYLSKPPMNSSFLFIAMGILKTRWSLTISRSPCASNTWKSADPPELTLPDSMW